MLLDGKSKDCQSIDNRILVYKNTFHQKRTRQKLCGYGGMADALDLGSSPKGCRFNSCYPHQNETKLNPQFSFFNSLLILLISKALQHHN